MNTQTTLSSPFNIVALGWGLSAALVVLFVVCLVVALVFPDWQASHGWIGLFSVAPMTSVRVWIDGIVFRSPPRMQKGGTVISCWESSGDLFRVRPT
jgi:hypothetical protein